MSFELGRRTERLPRLGALSVALLVGVVPAALSQGIGMPTSGLGAQGAPPSFGKEQLENSVKNNKAAPPPALPGAAPQQETIAPPSNVPALMSPNDELFDAINRGDMDSVRDALSRGADLNARNELGMTPIELSVDLGRSAISFLLLNLRGIPGTTPSGTGGQQLAAAAATGAAKPAPARPRPVHKVSARTADPKGGQMTLPKLVSGDGGAPVPQAGFLGFGGS